MKIKTLKVLFGIFLVFVAFCIAAEILLLIVNHWAIVLIANACIAVFGMYLFFKNNPETSLHRFYDERHYHKIRLKLPKKLNFTYKKQDYEFSCGPTVMQIKLERYGIFLSQREIMEFAGDKNFGTSPWEMTRTLNMIFTQYEKPFCARISYYTTCAELEKNIFEERGVIVLFISNFQQDGFTNNANYPHFGILSFISLAEDKVILVAPSSEYTRHGESEEGEVIMSRDEFHHRFYGDMKHLKTLEYKPTLLNQSYTRRKHTRRKNQIWNLVCRWVVMFAYITKIIKPGLAIIIEPVEK
jgi:hypothetical protein